MEELAGERMRGPGRLDWTTDEDEWRRDVLHRRKTKMSKKIRRYLPPRRFELRTCRATLREQTSWSADFICTNRKQNL
jgi:hypothetical protein